MSKFSELGCWSPPCPLCGEANFERLADNDRYGMGIPTCGCTRCGLLQTWPRPTHEAMARFYREHYREYYQGAASPDAGYSARFHKDTRLAYTAGLIAKHVGLREQARVLDMGCAEGTLFMQLLELQAGLQFVGIEPSDAFASYARQTTGCRTYPDLDALAASGEKVFDVVIINHVLEHVDDPVALLERLAGLLAPTGRIFIDVPDADRYDSAQMLHIAHLFHFTSRTLAGILGRAGWRVRQMECHAPPHHPASIWCIAEQDKAAAESHGSSVDVVCERGAWDAIRRSGRAVPLYLFKKRVLHSWLVAWFARVVRSARKRVSG